MILETDSKTRKLVRAIVKKHCEENPTGFSRRKEAEYRIQLGCSIQACHLNGTPLRLQAMLDADTFNRDHDVCGIHNSVSRKTGKLEGWFLPRFYDADAARAQGCHE